MILQKRYIFLIIILLLYSCNTETTNRSNKKQNNNYDLVKIKNIEINIPDSSTYKSNYISFCYNNNYLLRLNENVNGIEFIDIVNKKIDFVVSYDKEGPNGIGKIRGFYFHNFDTIFITSLNRLKIYISDTSGKIINTINISNSRYEFGDFSCYTDNKIIFNDNELYISTIPVAGIDRNPELFFTTKIGIKYNLIKRKTNTLHITYPKIYLNNRYTSSGFIFFSMAYNQLKNYLIYSFPADNNIIKYDILTQKKEEFKAQSKFFNKIPALKNKQAGYNKRRKFFLRTPKYYHIEYDKFRNIYYRFVLLPIEIESNKEYSPYLTFEMPFSIIVLDSNFRILTEKKFNKRIFNCNEYFITDEGLWLSNNNPFNPGFDENKLSYSLFKLKKSND